MFDKAIIDDQIFNEKCEEDQELLKKYYDGIHSVEHLNVVNRERLFSIMIEHKTIILSDDLINKLCSADSNKLKAYYEVFKLKKLDDINLKTLLESDYIKNEDIIELLSHNKVDAVNHFFNITDDLNKFIDNNKLSSDVIIDLFKKSIISKDRFNQLCQRNVDLLKCYYNCSSFNKTTLTLENIKALIDKEIIKDRKMIISLSYQYEFNDILKRFSTKTFKVGFVSFDMILVNENFYIGKFPVTKNLWRAVMGGVELLPSQFDIPQGNVSFFECLQFIDKLNKELTQKFRLPKKGEWILAAKGGKEQSHYRFSGSDSIGEVAWYYNNSCRIPQKVGYPKQPNSLGIYNMSGSVCEWCDDWYDSTQRFLCGGSYMSLEYACQLDYLLFNSPNTHSPEYGFRLAMDFE